MVAGKRCSWRSGALGLILGLLAAPALSAQGGAGPVPLPSVALPPELDRVLRDYETHWSARNPEALAALFADDGFVLQPGRPPVQGREAIAEAYRGSGGPLHLRALAFATDGSVGWIIGAYAAAQGQPDIGKFTLLLRRAPGGPWRIAADMDNSSRGG